MTYLVTCLLNYVPYEKEVERKRRQSDSFLVEFG